MRPLEAEAEELADQEVVRFEELKASVQTSFVLFLSPCVSLYMCAPNLKGLNDYMVVRKLTLSQVQLQGDVARVRSARSLCSLQYFRAA